MFQENKGRRSPLQIVGIAVIFVLAVLIILTFVIYGMFKDTNTAPKLFGYRVSVVPNDRMEPKVPEGAAVFVTENAEPAENNVVLCYIGEQLCIIRFVGTEMNPQTGEISYLVKYDSDGPDMIWGIERGDIVGVADTYDSFFGWVIRFASSKSGMMTIVIIPCLLVIIYEVAMLAVSRGAGRKKKSSSRSSSSSSSSSSRKSSERRPRPVSEVIEPVIRAVGGGPDEEGIPPEREDIQIPMDVTKEERFVEKQLRRANDRLSTTIHEAADGVETEEISLESIHFDDDVSQKQPEKTFFTEPAPKPQPAPAPKPEPFFFTEPEPQTKPRPKPAPAVTPAPAADPDTAELPDFSRSAPAEPKPAPAPAKEEPAKPASSGSASGIIGDLSASRIDELIRLLEEEKKRLGENNK